MGAPSIRTNTSWAFIGTAAYAGSQWIVFVMLVRALGVAEGGLFAYWVAVTGPVFVLANVRLRSLLATSPESSDKFSSYLAARLLTTFSAVVLSLLIGVAVAPGAVSLTILALIVGARACDAVSDICHGLFQRDLDMRSASIGLTVNGVCSVALVGSSLVFQPSLAWATAAYAVGSGAALFAWDLPRLIARVGVVAPWSIGRETGTAARQLIVKALPLGLSSAVGNVQSNLPRYVIGAQLGPAALGVFAALSYLPALGELVVNAIAEAGLPLLARDHRAAPARYRRRLLGLVAIGAGIGVVGLLTTAIAGRPALAWIYGREYTQHVGVLLWLMTVAAVSYAFVFLGAGTMARLRFRQQFLISLAGLSVMAGTIGPLVRQHGLTGAAWSLLACGIVQGCGYVALTAHDLVVTEPRHLVPDGLLKGVRS
jgi:O-antigen/teichoic acid export membrane protein